MLHGLFFIAYLYSIGIHALRRLLFLESTMYIICTQIVNCRKLIFFPNLFECNYWLLINDILLIDFRFFLDIYYTAPPCGSSDPGPPEWWNRWVKDIHYLHFGVILFLISGIVAVLVSTVTEPISEEHLYRLTFWSRHSAKIRVDLDQDTQYSPDEINTTGK